jgi:hypothetical protein
MPLTDWVKGPWSECQGRNITQCDAGVKTRSYVCPAGFLCVGPKPAAIGGVCPSVSQCLNGGVCVPGTTEQKCDCGALYDGPTCAHLVGSWTLNDEFNEEACQDRSVARCEQGYRTKSYSCSADVCNDPQPDPVEFACDPVSTCQNEGVCVAGAEVQSCNCANTGYAGDTCDIKIGIYQYESDWSTECFDASKKDCQAGHNVRRAKCTTAYCEGEPPKPLKRQCVSGDNFGCQNDGRCVKGSSSRSCNCVGTGYTGSVCGVEIVDWRKSGWSSCKSRNVARCIAGYRTRSVSCPANKSCRGSRPPDNEPCAQPRKSEICIGDVEWFFQGEEPFLRIMKENGNGRLVEGRFFNKNTKGKIVNNPAYLKWDFGCVAYGTGGNVRVELWDWDTLNDDDLLLNTRTFLDVGSYVYGNSKVFGTRAQGYTTLRNVYIDDFDSNNALKFTLSHKCTE